MIYGGKRDVGAKTRNLSGQSRPATYGVQGDRQIALGNFEKLFAEITDNHSTCIIAEKTLT